MKTVNADIYLIRHAQSRENSGEEYMPEFTIDDAPLSELGKKQAQALAERFEPGDIDMIFSSTLIRTAQTMQPTARKLGKPIIMLPELMEAETLVRGTPREKVKLLIPEAVTPDEDVFLPDPESPEQMTARAESAIKKILDMGGDGCRVIAASHHDFFGYLIRAALGLGLPATIRWSVLNCSVRISGFVRTDCPRSCIQTIFHILRIWNEFLTANCRVAQISARFFINTVN